MPVSLNFIALDLETATWSKSSICEIGIAIVKDSKVVETKSWLVKPYRNWYDSFNISIHGITPEMTKNCPSFFKMAKAQGIIPVAGMELTTSEDIHVVCLFEQLADALAFDKYVEENRVKRDDDNFILGYCGTLGHSYDIKCVLDAMIHLRNNGHNNISFWIIGDGPLKNDFFG